jgi:cell division protein FtsI (penicillin-binding protein 3)
MSPPSKRQRKQRKKQQRKSSLDQDWVNFIQKLMQVPEEKERTPEQSLRPLIARRINGVGILVLIFFAILTSRAGFLMLLPDDRLEDQTKKQFEFYEEIKGRRGNIVDRNHEIMATSVNLWHLVIDPSMVRLEDIDELVDTLSELLYKQDLEKKISKIDGETIKKQIRAKQKKNRRWFPIREKGKTSLLRLDPADVARVKEKLKALKKDHYEKDDRDFSSTGNSIFFEEHSYRFYPNLDDAAPLLGWTNRLGEGAGGAEFNYDSILRGEKFRIVSIRDRRNNKVHRPLIQQGLPQAQDGQSIALTIDRSIQHATDIALQKTLETTKAKSAYAVVMDIHTGEILAISSQPTLNLNERRRDLNLLQNYALNSLYEPGSVLKPLVAAVALEEGVMTPETLINCENGRWYAHGGRITDEHRDAFLSLTQVIQNSSNIGIAKVALELGANTMLGYFQDFGFGQRTEVHFPSTPRGVLRSAQSIKPIELMTTAYGYGISTTMLQLVSAYATIGNGGKRMKTILLKEKLNANMEVIERNLPEVTHTVLSPKTARQVITMMERVVTNGTGKSIKVPGYRFAGKTGTAKKIVDGAYSDTDRVGTFIGLLPANDPQIVIAVTVDTPTVGPTFGAAIAGPAFSEIALASMRRLGIPPDPNLLPPEKDPPLSVGEDAHSNPELQWRSDKEFAAPNLIGLSLRDALRVIGSANFDVRFQGHGRVKTQSPIPGSLISPQDLLELTLQ